MLNDWVSRIADQLEGQHPTGKITLASGISPSGPIHMGNLREVITTHLIADELLRRGRDARHLHSWDDYDRFRKVPQNVDGVNETWEQYIGLPLSEVPAPNGSSANSWADHFRDEFVAALESLHIRFDGVSQYTAYRSGVYNSHIITAMNERFAIREVLRSFQTKEGSSLPEDYFPYKPYCSMCGKDSTRVTDWNSDSEEISYTCECGNAVISPISEVSGKLVWKVDWPMRWAFERVDFEPGGVDHYSPGSSWEVGEHIAPIFGWTRPHGQGYSFVGIEGMAKMASSAGGAPTPQMLLEILTPEIIRWMYVRQRPEQAFTIDVANNTPRLYDEWDALCLKVESASGIEGDVAAYERSRTVAINGTDIEPVNNFEDATVKFSAWASYADLTLLDVDRMVDLALEGHDVDLNLQRIPYATNWVRNYVSIEDRTVVRESHNIETFESLSQDTREAIQMLADGLEEYWDDIAELTRWSFGVAKVHFGYSLDERKLSKEAKTFQREYFKAVYQLLIGRDAGPRLPALLRSIGLDTARTLLVGGN